MADCVALPSYKQTTTFDFGEWVKKLLEKKEKLADTANLEFQEETVFDELVTSKKFIEEAEEAKKAYLADPSKFIDLTKKYSQLLK